MATKVTEGLGREGSPFSVRNAETPAISRSPKSSAVPLEKKAASAE